MYIMTPVLKTSCRLLLCNIVRYTFPKTAVDNFRKTEEKVYNFQVFLDKKELSNTITYYPTSPTDFKMFLSIEFS